MKRIGIVAFAFGAPQSIEANKRIAEMAKKAFWSRHRISIVAIYTQRDIQFSPPWRAEDKEDVYYIDEEPDNPPPTLCIARRAVEWAEKFELAEFLVVAARPHMKRCVRDIEFAIREANAQIDVFICGDVYKYSRGGWFCSDSIQKRTRSFLRWWSREIILRLLPMAIYKRVAG